MPDGVGGSMLGLPLRAKSDMGVIDGVVGGVVRGDSSGLNSARSAAVIGKRTWSAFDVVEITQAGCSGDL